MQQSFFTLDKYKLVAAKRTGPAYVWCGLSSDFLWFLGWTRIRGYVLKEVSQRGGMNGSSFDSGFVSTCSGQINFPYLGMFFFFRALRRDSRMRGGGPLWFGSLMHPIAMNRSCVS